MAKPAPLQLCKASKDAIDDCPEFGAHHAPGTVGALPTSFAGWLAYLYPYFVEAIQALIASGIANPTPAQILTKCHELAAAP